MWQRRFVPEPLAEIAPNLLNPANGRSIVQELAPLRASQRAKKLGDLARIRDDLL